MSSSREGMKARSGIHARLRARHRKQEAVDEKRHQCMKLNIQAASDHAVLGLSFQGEHGELEASGLADTFVVF